MTNKKNKFFTFCFSLIPGAGEMYLGFYKMGISLMCIFGLVAAFTGTFSMPVISFFLPVIWFYSFFHVHNLNSLPDDEFYSLEDDWLIPFNNDSFELNDWVRKYRKLIAGILILFGISILWKILTNFTNDLLWMFHMSDYFHRFIYRLNSTIPQGVIALLIIVLGVKMIKNKKEDLDSDQDPVIPSPPYIEVKDVRPEQRPQEPKQDAPTEETK